MSNHEFEELQIKQYSNRTRAFIKIQEGCNQFFVLTALSPMPEVLFAAEQKMML